MLSLHFIEAEAYRSNGILRKRLKCNATNRSRFRRGRADLLILEGSSVALSNPVLNQGAKNSRSGLGAEARLKCRVRDARYDPGDVVVDLRFDAPVLSLGTGDVDR